ncbi:MAG: methionine--tRNA ligase [Alphaproteobacteria bacterium]|nr:methionine--tRNA ligase [Alphaproteobacteria bacterium]
MTRILITSALPYINGVKHLGNLVGSMLPADVYARFQRQRRGAQNVLFICATDEHGTPAELAALDEGLDVAAYCAKWHAIQAELCRGFLLSFDYFGRSSSAQNHRLTQGFAQTLWEAGFIEERVTRQVFSRAENRFLPDRYVVGTCPHCGYERARGDQCENCTRVLDPVDLIAPRSALSGSAEIEIRDSKHLFLRQSLFEGKLRAWIEGKQAEWPHLVTSIALKWLDEGLQDRGITRDLSWGVPVNAEAWGPNPDGVRPDVTGLKGKVFYVWFDAPIAYIGASSEWADANPARGGWERWWRLPEAGDVTYVEFMGKDNVPFHTVGFPCTLLGLNERRVDGTWQPATNRPWKLVDKLKGFNWLNYDAGKFSTSQKRGIFMDTALEILPADLWRWYLMANAPESADSSFTWDHFAASVNKDLADVLGNFINRVLKFTQSRFGAAIPEEGRPGPAEEDLILRLERHVGIYTALMEDMQFRKAAAELRAIWVAGNEYAASRAPWTLIKTDRAEAAVAVRTAFNLIRLMAVLSKPFIPDTAARILKALHLPEGEDRWPVGHVREEFSRLAGGHAFSVPDVLFQKIEDAQVVAWKEQFAGTGGG